MNQVAIRVAGGANLGNILTTLGEIPDTKLPAKPKPRRRMLRELPSANVASQVERSHQFIEPWREPVVGRGVGRQRHLDIALSNAIRFDIGRGQAQIGEVGQLEAG